MPDDRRRTERSQGVDEYGRSRENPRRDRDVDRKRSRRSRSRFREKSRSPDRKRRRSISPRREEVRKRQRSRTRSRSRSRGRREREERERKSTKVEKVDEEVNVFASPDMDDEMDDPDAVARLMGFTSFDSSKGKKVEGNDVGGVNVALKRKYRQYMNRRGGFNRPLDAVK